MPKYIYDDFTIQVDHDKSKDAYDLLVFRNNSEDNFDNYSSVGWRTADLAFKKGKAYLDYIYAKAKFMEITNA